jgi:hypothetical protein
MVSSAVELLVLIGVVSCGCLVYSSVVHVTVPSFVMTYMVPNSVSASNKTM